MPIFKLNSARLFQTVFGAMVALQSISAALAAAPILAAPAASHIAETLGDAEILQVLDIALKGDRACAKEALDTSHNVRIKGYADDLIRDANILAKAADTFARTKGITPVATELSSALATQIAAAVADLHASYGRAFDHTFLTQQVDAQFGFLDLIGQRLTSNASDPELQALLAKADTLVARHLLFARQLRGDI